MRGGYKNIVLQLQEGGKPRVFSKMGSNFSGFPSSSDCFRIEVSEKLLLVGNSTE